MKVLLTLLMDCCSECCGGILRVNTAENRGVYVANFSEGKCLLLYSILPYFLVSLLVKQHR